MIRRSTLFFLVLNVGIALIKVEAAEYPCGQSQINGRSLDANSCNQPLKSTQNIIECINYNYRTSGVGSLDNQTMVSDYASLFAVCKDTYKDIALLDISTEIENIYPILRDAIKSGLIKIDQDLLNDFADYRAIIYNVKIPLSVQKAIALNDAYTAALNTHDQNLSTDLIINKDTPAGLATFIPALVFIQNALMGFPCNKYFNKIGTNAKTKIKDGIIKWLNSKYGKNPTLLNQLTSLIRAHC